MWIKFTVYLDEADWQDMDLENNIEILWTHYPVLDYLDELGYHRHQSIINDIEKFVVIVSAAYEVPEAVLTLITLKHPTLMTTRQAYEKVEIFA